MTFVGEERLATQEQRVVDAALRCIARWGIAKTTLDDVAREASCSRATIYRLFPGGKDALLDAIVQAELTSFFGALSQRLADAGDDLEELLVRGICFAASSLHTHEALQFVLAYEPEVILPRVAFKQADRMLAVIVPFAVPYLVPHVGEEEAPGAAEWLARIVLSYTLAPAAGVDVGDESSVRRLVRTFVLPGLVHHHEQVRQ
jgi:AcrR family transcriptional regulator